MLSFEKLKDYILDDCRQSYQLVCEVTDQGVYQIRCVDDNVVIVTSNDIPAEKFATHVGHDVQFRGYGYIFGIEEHLDYITIECMDCNKVVIYGSKEWD